jgi:Domain of unknown function (DUF305)
MPSLLDRAEVARLGSTEASSFDVLFLELMTQHHKGAVAMADSQLRDGSDPAPAEWRMPSVMRSKGRSRCCTA